MSKENEAMLLKDFNDWSVQKIGLTQLSKTHMENYPDGTPVGGIYHYVLISNILEMLEKRNIPYDVREIFAANNKFKRSPGVTILPEVESREGIGSPESHILRRVFCNINIHGQYTDEARCYNIAVSYTQLGICVGFGPYVYACHNQHICSAERIVSNYTLRGNERIPTLHRQTDTILKLIDAEISRMDKMYDTDLTQVDALKQVPFTSDDTLRFVGMLVAERCRCSSPNPLIHVNRIAPLTSAQINDFCHSQLRKEGMVEGSAYDIYQAGTEYLKPKDVPFENICLQSASFFKLLNDYCNERGEERKADQ